MNEKPPQAESGPESLESLSEKFTATRMKWLGAVLAERRIEQEDIKATDRILADLNNQELRQEKKELREALTVAKEEERRCAEEMDIAFNHFVDILTSENATPEVNRAQADSDERFRASIKNDEEAMALMAGHFKP
jgi:hypothetical protein